MGNLVLQLKLMKNCLVYQWKSTLFSIISVGIFTFFLLFFRNDALILNSLQDSEYRLLCLIGQFVVILVFILCTWVIARNKVVNNASEFKAFIVIGLNNSEVLICLISNSLIISTVGFLLGAYFITSLPFASFHIMDYSIWEAVIMIMGGASVSVLVSSTAIKKSIE